MSPCPAREDTSCPIPDSKGEEAPPDQVPRVADENQKSLPPHITKSSWGKTGEVDQIANSTETSFRHI